MGSEWGKFFSLFWLIHSWGSSFSFSILTSPSFVPTFSLTYSLTFFSPMPLFSTYLNNFSGFFNFESKGKNNNKQKWSYLITFFLPLSLPLNYFFFSLSLSLSSSYSRVTILEGWSVDVVLCVKQITIVSNKSNVTFLTTSSPLTSLSFFFSFLFLLFFFFFPLIITIIIILQDLLVPWAHQCSIKNCIQKREAYCNDYLKETKNGIRIVI